MRYWRILIELGVGGGVGRNRDSRTHCTQNTSECKGKGYKKLPPGHLCLWRWICWGRFYVFNLKVSNYNFIPTSKWNLLKDTLLCHVVLFRSLYCTLCQRFNFTRWIHPFHFYIHLQSRGRSSTPTQNCAEDFVACKHQLNISHYSQGDFHFCFQCLIRLLLLQFYFLGSLIYSVCHFCHTCSRKFTVKMALWEPHSSVSWIPYM